MFRRPVLFFLLSGIAFAQGALVPGYERVLLPRSVAVPVRVVGAGVSEQDVRVSVLVPSAAARQLPEASPAAAIPGLPSTVGGCRLVVLREGAREALTLRNGRMAQADVPVFAYEPAADGASVDFAAIWSAIGVPVAPAAPATPAPAAFTPKPATVIVSQQNTPFAPPAGASAFVPPPAVPVIATAEPIAVTLTRVEPKRSDTSIDAVGEQFEAAARVADTQAGLPASPATAAGGTTWDDVVSKDFSFKDEITVGQVIVDERQLLRSRLPVTVAWPDKPLSEALLTLASASGIDFALGSLPGDNIRITTRFSKAPFAALEQLARQWGVGIYHEKGDPLWIIRKMDPEALIMRTYQLQHILLGTSSGATADGRNTFGPGFDNNNGMSSGGRGGYGSGMMGMGGSRGGMSSGGYGIGMNGGLGTNSSTNGLVAPISLPHEASTFGERFTQPSDVLFTIRAILEQADTTTMVSDMHTPDDPQSGPRLTTTPSVTREKSHGLVSYKAETNTLLVLGTERQQQWVAEYLKQVDRPTTLIGLNAMFVESDASPSKTMGADWSSTAVDWNVSGPTSLNWGTLGHLTGPSNIAVTSAGFAAKLSAFIRDTKSRVARYPQVVTTNNREVRIATTSNIPIISNASTVSGVTNGTGTVVTTPTTDYTAGTQEVGTIITLLPTRIGSSDQIHIQISIEISSGDSNASGSGKPGEQLTGRIPTTSTTYEGEVIIPANHTLAIGGLERIAEQSSIGRVAGLSKIPVFGFLFKKGDENFANTNITLFITPRILDGESLPIGTVGGGGAGRALINAGELDARAKKEALSKP